MLLFDTQYIDDVYIIIKQMLLFLLISMYVCLHTCMYATHEWMHAEITENVDIPQDVDIGKQMGVLCQVSEQQTHLFSPCFIVLIMLPYSEHEKLNFRYYFARRKAFCLFVFILLFCFALFLVVQATNVYNNNSAISSKWIYLCSTPPHEMASSVGFNYKIAHLQFKIKCLCFMHGLL